MKRGTVLLVVTGSLASLAVVAFAMSGLLFMDNSDLRRELSRLREEQWQARGEAEQQRDAAAAAVAAGETLRARVERLEAELAAARPSSVAHTNPPVRASRVSVYLGRELVGQAFVIPSRPGADPAGPPLDPVVVLDESWKARLAASRPAPATAEAPQAVTVNYNYASDPWGSSWWPVYWWGVDGGTTNCQPTVPGSTPVAQSPSTHRSGIWRPTAKPYLPNPSSWPIVTPQRAPQVRPTPTPIRPEQPMAPVIRTTSPSPRLVPR